MSKLSTTVLEHLIYVEGFDFNEALRTARRKMIEERDTETRAEQLLNCSAIANIAAALPLLIINPPLGLLAAAGGGFFLYSSSSLRRPDNELHRAGEEALWSNSDIMTWIVKLWQAGIPIGQIVTGYNQYCEKISLAEKGDQFLPLSQGVLNQFVGNSLDLFSGTRSKALPEAMPVEDNNFRSVYKALADADDYEPPIQLPDFKKLREQGTRPKVEKKIEPSPWNEAEDEKDMEAIAKAFQNSPNVALAAQSMERQINILEAEQKEVQFISQKATTAIEMLLLSQFESRAFFGAQRTGKSYLAACAAKQLDCNVYFINLAAYERPGVGRESERYFGVGSRTVSADLATIYDQAEAAVEITKAIQILQDFMKDPGASLLVVDEWISIGGKSHLHAEALAPLMNMLSSTAEALASSGKQRKKAIWAISPKLVAGNLTQAGLGIKSLDLCYVTIPPGRSLDWEGQAITFDETLYKQLNKNYGVERPGYGHMSDRIVYINGRWMPVGKLPEL